MHKPRFPLYIPSKGRAEFMMTSHALTRMGMLHYIVVEPAEVDAYHAASKGLLTEVLPLDMAYKRKYDTCDKLGLTKGVGPGAARNFIWDHAIANGYAWHWVMDDNIRFFQRLHNNRKITVSTPVFWTIMEDFVLRYKNVAMAGPNYTMFAPQRTITRPFSVNTRIYSCNFIRNDVPFRWRGRYNEDTILSLDMLRGGWCTIQFYAFLQGKVGTQTMKGGNTDVFYDGGSRTKAAYSTTGTIAKSQMLANVYPDIARVQRRYGRVHHMVDYSEFQNRPLVLRDDVTVKKGTDDYGLNLVHRA